MLKEQVANDLYYW